MNSIDTAVNNIFADKQAKYSDDGTIDIAASIAANEKSSRAHAHTARDAFEAIPADVAVGVATGAVSIFIPPVGLIMLWAVVDLMVQGVTIAIEKTLGAKDNADARAYAAMAGKNALTAPSDQ